MHGEQHGGEILSQTSEATIFKHGDRTIEIREVWADNLEAEMVNIRELVDKYPYVAMDTEFPGVVARPIGAFQSSTDYQYQTLRCNVDLLKIIQLGLSFCDDNGDYAPGCPTWQFNFKFSLEYVKPRDKEPPPILRVLPRVPLPSPPAPHTPCVSP
jgi:hypothetical protein